MAIEVVKGKGYRLAVPIEFLNKERLRSSISPDAINVIRRLDIFEKIGSTNQYLLERSEKHAHVVLAEYQTEGRGQQGRHWLSPFGSGLNLSIGWRFGEAAERLNCLALSAGVAILHALMKMGFDGIQLKWPNDLFFQDKKLGGVLIESRSKASEQLDVVLGVGLNIAVPVRFLEQIERPCTGLAEVKKTLPGRHYIIAGVISELIMFLDGYTKHSVDAMLGKWRLYDCMRGRHAIFKSRGHETQGLVLGIDDNGALIMSTSKGVEHYIAGEISLRSGT